MTLPSETDRGSRTDLIWIAAICGYFLLQALLRLSVHGAALELDESEAFWFARSLAAGYSAQPPLYFWLQWLAFQLFGEGLLAIAALKAALMAGFGVAVYALLRHGLPAAAAGAATLGLALTPDISWESQRALTHSAIVALLSVLACLAALALLRRPTPARFALLGVSFGLGILSKHNFLALLTALPIAATALPGARVAVKANGLALAALATLIVISPYLIWVIAYPDLAGDSVHKLKMAEPGFIAPRLAGLAQMAVALAGWLILPALTLGWLLWRSWRRGLLREAARLPILRFLALFLAAGIATVLIVVLASGANRVAGRWLIPIMWPLAPLAVALVWSALAARGQRVLTLALAALWLLIAALLPAASSYRDADFRALLAGLPDQPLVVDRHWLAGNIALAQPDRAVFLDGYMTNPPPGPVLLIGTETSLPGMAARLGLTLGPATPLPVPGLERDQHLLQAEAS